LETTPTTKTPRAPFLPVFHYPEGYRGPNSPAEQLVRLVRIFGLDPGPALTLSQHLPKLPYGAEGWFVVPTDDALKRKFFRKAVSADEKFTHIRRLMLRKVAEHVVLNFWRDLFRLDPQNLRSCERTKRALERIAITQADSDFLIIPAQLGLRHYDRSPDQAREFFIGSAHAPEALARGDEFGLGIVEISSILLTHHERLYRDQDLGMDCTGEAFAPQGDGNYSYVNTFGFEDERVHIRTSPSNHVRRAFATPSGFII